MSDSESDVPEFSTQQFQPSASKLEIARAVVAGIAPETIEQRALSKWVDSVLGILPGEQVSIFDRCDQYSGIYDVIESMRFYFFGSEETVLEKQWADLIQSGNLQNYWTQLQNKYTEDGDLTKIGRSLGPSFSGASFAEKRQDEIIDEALTYAGPKKRIGLVACRFCKSKNTESMEKQTRGGDEAMTNFHRCNDCNKGWREG